MSYINIAIEHAKYGIPIVPINPNTDNHEIFVFPTVDIDYIKDIWNRKPKNKIGIKLGGEYGLFMIHICTTKEMNGYKSLALFENQYSKLPKTLTIKTPFVEIRLYSVPEKYRPLNINPKFYKIGMTLEGNEGIIISPIEADQDRDSYRFLNTDIGISELPDKIIKLLLDNTIPFFTCDYSEESVENYDDEILTPLTKEEISQIESTNREWEEPKELRNLSNSVEYPIEALPTTIRNAVEEVVSFVQCPVALAASSALGALSLAIQPYYNVARSKTLVSPISIFFLSMAESGTRKSSCDKIFMQSLRNYQEEKTSESRVAIAKYKSDITIWEEKYKALKDKLRNETKKGNDTSELEETINIHLKAKPVEPKVPKLFYNDFSIEALTSGLATKWPSAGVMSAEGGIVFGSYGMSKDAALKTIAACNTLWDGQPLYFDKLGSGSITVDGTRLTISLQVQPNVFDEFTKKSSGSPRDIGFLARFLICEQKITECRKYRDEPDEWKYLDIFNKRISKILSKKINFEHGKIKFNTIYLSEYARKAWIAYHDQIEEEIINDGLFSDIKDFASKAAENIVRLAALFHIFEHGESEICENCVKIAKDIVKWHLLEAKRKFGKSMEVCNKINKFYSGVINLCKKNGVTNVTKREASQYGHVYGAELNIVIDELEKLNCMRLSTDGKSVEVNPKLLSE